MACALLNLLIYVLALLSITNISISQYRNGAGFNMSIHHNGKLDGKNKAKKWKYTTWWKYYKDEFPVAREMCDHLVKFAG